MVQGLDCNCNNCTTAGNIIISTSQLWYNATIIIGGNLTVNHNLNITQTSLSTQSLFLSSSGTLTLGTSSTLIVNDDLSFSNTSVFGVILTNTTGNIIVHGCCNLNGVLQIIRNENTPVEVKLASCNCTSGSFSAVTGDGDQCQYQLEMRGNDLYIFGVCSDRDTSGWQVQQIVEAVMLGIVGIVALVLAVVLVWKRKIVFKKHFDNMEIPVDM